MYNFFVKCLMTFSLFLPTLLFAQAPPAQFTTETVYASANGVTSLEFDHAGRLLYAEKQGRIMFLSPNGSGGFLGTPTLFADFISQVNPADESGFLGMVLDPDYANTRYIYLFYTTNTDQRLSRITANLSFTAMQAGSEVILLSGLPRNSTTHKAGDIHFAPSDPTAIFIALGDDSDASNAQNLSSYIGKILRVDATTGLGLPDNPFFNGNSNSVQSRIFAHGFRNPFRTTFHPNAPNSNIIYSSENGNATDRLSFVRKGSNGAWSAAGDAGGFLSPPDPNHRVLATLTPSMVGVAISTGGPFGTNVIYWGQIWPNNIKRFQLSGAELDTATALDGGGLFKTGGQSTVDFEFGPDGHLYGSSSGNGASTAGFYPIQRNRYVGGSAPIAAFTTLPSPAFGAAPLLVQFTDQSTAPGSSISSRLWQFGDGTTSTATNPSRTYINPGVYSVSLTVTNAVGQQSTSNQNVRAVRNVQVSYNGVIRDGRTLSALPLATATELRFYQSDGITAASFPGGVGVGENILNVATGGVNNQVVNLSLTSSTVVISAGEATTDGVHSAKRGWVLPAGNGPHSVVGDYHLSNALIHGQIRNSRNQALAVDIGIRLGTSSSSTAYPIAGGRDYLSGVGITPSGVAHRVDSDALGWYHLALRNADANGPFQIDAVADSGSVTHAAIAAEHVLTSGISLNLNLVSGQWNGGLDCNDLSGIAVTNNVNYATQIQNLFNLSCTGCHSSNASNVGGLDLTSANSLSALLAPSSGAPGVRRVQGGASNRSYLMEKIACNNTQNGIRMRPGSVMPLADQALIRDWIMQSPSSGNPIFSNSFE